MFIIGRHLSAQQLNAPMTVAPAFPRSFGDSSWSAPNHAESALLAMRLSAEPLPFLPSAPHSSPAPTPPPAARSLASSVSLSPAVRPEITRQLTFRDRLRLYLKSTYGRGALMDTALDASYDQMVDDQPQWGRGSKGYERRFASDYAPLVISNTVAFGIAAADHEDARYKRSNENGVWRRTRFAIVHTFISPIDGGGQTLAYSRLSGTYAAAFIANAWLPERQAHFSSGLSRGTMCLASDVVSNVLREFTPDLKKLLHRL